MTDFPGRESTEWFAMYLISGEASYPRFTSVKAVSLPNTVPATVVGVRIGTLFSLVLKVLGFKAVITSFRRLFPTIIENMSVREIC